MKKILSTLALAIITASAAFAGTDSKKVVIAPVQEDLFRAGEIQIDASFAALLGRYNGRNANGIGGNLGLNYFITRYIGIGVDNTVGGWVGSGNNGAFDNLQGNLILRYPIESLHLAPYALVGGGATWGSNRGQGNGNVGGGIEYRFTRNIGTFVDSRYLYGNNSLNSSLTRIGLRFSF